MTHKKQSNPSLPLFLSISFISASALAYEILLIRIFSIIQWHHFAYMVISLALLGFGASGTFLTLNQRWIFPRFSAIFSINAVLFSFTILGSFSLAQSIPFNSLEIAWDPKQLFYLFGLYLILFFPFFFAANCLGLALMKFKDQIHQIYRFDLLGAGLGAFGIVFLLFLFFPSNCLRLLSAGGFFGAFLISLDQSWQGSRRWSVAFLLGAVLLPFFWPMSWSALNISEYKGIEQVLRVPDAKVISQRSSPLGLLQVVESPTIPFRQAPGISLNSFQEPPPQLGLFTDGDSLSAITYFDGNLEPLGYLDFLTSALPYHLLDQPEVLILGGGGGSEILLAKFHRPKKIEVVELNPQVLDLIKKTHRNFAGPLLDDNVQVYIKEARGFISGSEKNRKYDLIQISLMDSFGAASAGLYSLSENYIYTIEAFQIYLSHLKPGGILSITRWLKLPPRDSLKIFSTATESLRKRGVENPEKHLVLIRGWKTSTLLMKNGEFTFDEIQKTRSFVKDRSFDVAYYPGIIKGEVNRFNILPYPYFFEGAISLLGERRQEFLDNYKFQLEPATDDRPFFFHFFKWSTLPEIISLREKGGLPLLEWGYPILIATLLQAIVASFFLILSPLLWLRRHTLRRKGWALLGFYFFTLGLGFLFIEIVFIQRFILFLSHPLYSISVVLCGFLIFAGIGSGYSNYFAQKLGRNFEPDRFKALGTAVLGIIFFSLLYQFLLPIIFHHFISWSNPIKILISVLLIAPLGFFMGMPFPLGLALLGEKQPELIPWAWGINGCASVLSSILVILFAIHWGFTVVIVSAVILYGLSWLALSSYLKIRENE